MDEHIWQPSTWAVGTEGSGTNLKCSKAMSVAGVERAFKRLMVAVNIWSSSPNHQKDVKLCFGTSIKQRNEDRASVYRVVLTLLAL